MNMKRKLLHVLTPSFGLKLQNIAFLPDRRSFGDTSRALYRFSPRRCAAKLLRRRELDDSGLWKPVQEGVARGRGEAVDLVSGDGLCK
jgi:hypothetical protein